MVKPQRLTEACQMAKQRNSKTPYTRDRKAPRNTESLNRKPPFFCAITGIQTDLVFSMPKIIGFDTETYLTKEDKHFAYKFYSAQFFCPDMKLNRFLTDPVEVAKTFSNRTQGAIFLASNAEYDFTVLAKILDKDYFKMRCLYNGSRFLYGKLERKGHCWTIYDLRNIFTNWSLAKMGKFLNVQKLEKPEYLGKRKPETPMESFYFRQYAMRDAEIGYHAGKWLLNKFGRLNVSLPSMAFNYFNRNHKPNGLYLRVEPEITHCLRLAYKGGRCESWIRGSPDRKIFSYDAVSLYPSVMLEKPYPIGQNEFKLKSSVDLSHDGIALCTVKQDADIPFLCTRAMCADGNIKLLFPNGVFQAWFTYPELRYFSVKRLGKILKVEKAYETKGSRFYFKSYIKEFFELKQIDKDHADFWKLCMNSLYGKFAQDAHSPELEIKADSSIVASEMPKKRKQSFLTNILVSAYITAFSRIKMHKKYQEIGAENLVYTDTDSLHSFKPFSNTGKGLGELDFKTEGQGTYVRSKFYILNDMVRCRGMERIFSAEHVRKLIELNDVTIFGKVLLRLRSAYRQHKPFLTEKPLQKRFSLLNDCKRIYEKDLIGKDLLTNYTKSIAVYLDGSS
jgi:hypothetical protein